MFTITPSHIIQYLYCPRFTYFEYVLSIPQYEEKNYKVLKGRVLHDEKLEKNKKYLRSRIGVVNKHLDQYLANDFLRGRIDEVLELSDGSMAPLDYKFAIYEDLVYLTYKTQLQCYAVLIEDNFGQPVKKGFLVYVRSKNRLIEEIISEPDKQNVKDCAMKIHRIIQENIFPSPTKHKARCNDCTYANICIK